MRRLFEGFSILLLGTLKNAAQASLWTVTYGWFRFLPAGLPAGGYFTAQNIGNHDLAITGAQSPACGTLMLHKSRDTGGIDRRHGYGGQGSGCPRGGTVNGWTRRIPPDVRSSQNETGRGRAGGVASVRRHVGYFALCGPRRAGKIARSGILHVRETDMEERQAAERSEAVACATKINAHHVCVADVARAAMLLEIALVIVLGRPEGGGGLDLGDNGLLVAP